MELFPLFDLSGPPGWVAAVFLGLILGSFSSAMTWRIPRGISWVSSRSACPSCQHVLSAPDLVPLLSWIFLRGRCRHCRAAIGWRYPLIELVTLLICLMLYGLHGFTLASLVVMLAVPFLVALVAIDLEFMILPDQINIILGILGAIFVFLGAYAPFKALASAVMAAVIYAGLVFGVSWGLGKVLKKEALGFGDVKFFAVAGMWLGLDLLPVFLMMSGLIGVGMGLFWKIILRQNRFPFGPALIASFAVCLLFGSQIRGFWAFLL